MLGPSSASQVSTGSRRCPCLRWSRGGGTYRGAVGGAPKHPLGRAAAMVGWRALCSQARSRARRRTAGGGRVHTGPSAEEACCCSGPNRLPSSSGVCSRVANGSLIAGRKFRRSHSAPRQIKERWDSFSCQNFWQNTTVAFLLLFDN
jgi:hypothetical protein